MLLDKEGADRRTQPTKLNIVRGPACSYGCGMWLTVRLIDEGDPSAGTRYTTRGSSGIPLCVSTAG